MLLESKPPVFNHLLILWLSPVCSNELTVSVIIRFFKSQSSLFLEGQDGREDGKAGDVLSSEDASLIVLFLPFSMGLALGGLCS